MLELSLILLQLVTVMWEERAFTVLSGEEAHPGKVRGAVEKQGGEEGSTWSI